MNSALATQVGRNDERKRKYREIDTRARNQSRNERLRNKPLRKRVQIEESCRRLLKEDPLACDLLISLFATALFSYRRGSICEPFPCKEFVVCETGEKNFEDVESFTQALPSIAHLNSSESTLCNLPLPALKLLSWVIDSQNNEEFKLRQIPLEQYQRETMNIDAKQSKYSDPVYIFKVDYTDQHHSYPIFKRAKDEFNFTIGFHGSPFENFHSILRNGLDATFGKEALFGDGIYLSSDRDVAFSFLKSAKNFSKNSILGERLGCLVCAEVACKPGVVRLSKEEALTRGLAGNMDKILPKGYIVSEENDYVLVKYLLLYKDFQSTTPKQSRNICQYIALFYIFILISLWMVRSPEVRRFYKSFDF
eukprot:TRINITY_DN5399_c0_g1_i10.p1 TRINITY_DN5399_c0_g1~~TRINITY_DN5399_c0_g1_i10.p1  ORF type:complete len:365 (+),score=52.57 TRINITY_DN5399_c0_g1_i10:488-1582(+)